MIPVLSRCVRFNARLSFAIHRRLPWRLTRSLFLLQESIVASLTEGHGPTRLLDVGAGRSSPYARPGGANGAIRIIGIDLSPEQLAANLDVDSRIVADAGRSIPLRDGSVDVIVTRSTLEHLGDTSRFMGECFRVLRPGGSCVHVLPGRLAPFAVLNRLLPAAVTRRLMDRLYPEQAGQWGFPADYRDCSSSRMVRVLREAGLEVRRVDHRYYQSTYYRAFLPAYVMSVVYDALLWALGIEALAAQMLLVARKPSATSRGGAEGGARAQRRPASEAPAVPPGSGGS